MNLLKLKFAGFLLKISRLRLFQPIIKFFFNHLTPHLPVERIRENEHWIAFYHPNPDYPLHILILPKHYIASLPDAPDDIPDLYTDLFKIFQDLIQQFHLTEHGYRLITNGGPNQTIPQWHWHLISESENFNSPSPNV